MKKIFTSFSVLLATISVYSQVLTQNATPNVVSSAGSVSCSSQAEGYTSDNSYYRVFKLSDYGINYDYNITNVAFGVQTASAQSFPVSVSIHTLTGTSLPTGTLTAVGAAVPVSVSATNNLGMVNTGTNLTRTIPSGSTFVVKIWHDGSTAVPPQQFFMGTNSGAQTGPSYLSSTDCGGIPPTATGTGALASFASAKWVMTITGQNATLGVTEVINSKDLQIFPNPVKDVLRFRFSNNLRSESIEIYDLTGKIMTSIQNVQNVNEVNMSNYIQGNYILKVKATDGKVYIQKIIKK
ncbi:T9SS type A sorting domain-containing protein [Chryseobacterium sp. LC2016-29]|uniref:T9SS type A sorting domain-containing protein n=1 Tax=Chryseobacterium sp. LC2016-29 TaxID=2897331 RepID=UPI001E655687|nr:T9SS type A sorting domain-containing protein [Chryseobacterium sp. LC2016-29]MCD0478085.1 T9SS type A sorting domain-containing protein [Chryseobacterium sp. LC2016-29]